MRRGIVLPERAPVLDLPAFDGLVSLLVARIRGQMVFESPTPNAGPVGLEVEAPEQFAGRGIVGRGRLGTEQLGEQIGYLSRPKRGMISSGEARNPALQALFDAGS
jgi:hypothetical protein